MASVGDQIEHGRLSNASPSPSHPPWQQPTRRRGRNASACSQCHSRKQKCNGGQPCLNCIRRGVDHLCSGPPASHSRQKPAPRPLQSAVASVGQSSSSTPPIETSVAVAATGGDEPSRPRQDQPRIGQLWRSRGAPAFFGTSYFGPQVAATMINSPAPDIPAGTGSSSARKTETINARPFRDESGPYSQIWDLLGLLPRRKSFVDHLVERFFSDLNGHIDAVHPASFQQSYSLFWERKSGFDDVTTVDLRWLALLFVILAIGAYLDCPRTSSADTQRDYEEASLRFYWASRRAIVIAPSFYGESTDLVRAGVLITRYLIQTQRLAESWLTVGFAARLGIAQGLHVDGEKWGLPRRATETRRRLWCHLYTLDRMISLALGRPYCISDAQSLLEEPQNVYVDDLTDDEAHLAQPRPLSDPTISVMASLEYRLAKVIGQIQEACFHFDTASYRDVLALDERLMGWKQALPPYFALDGPDLSLDATHPFLAWQRLYLHTSFHFARITLHRPYLLRPSLTDRYQFSRDACLSSARADLKTRLDSHFHSVDSAAHYTWSLSAHQLCNSAIILGILAVREASSVQNPGIVDDLEAYCEMQRSEMWLSEFGLAEVSVVEMCIAKLKKQLQYARDRDRDRDQARDSRHRPRPRPSGLGVSSTSGPAAVASPTPNALNDDNDANDTMLTLPTATATTTASWTADQSFTPAISGPTSPIWQDQLFPGSLPGFTDLQTWQEVIDEIGADFSNAA
ncbi:hypothetical protein A1O3_05925 [Capronia epimyces CBS 606.96]|uniref:Zn(2)-C6 fungal-type domain-containing protein n=1 Tax=Capronia epimyces CBS 606.96 TaxID=1182542 RepID=W9Y6I9_9EURO|nr:uncharacterized protein A1O3_05925 [Capronia epimyces CBS 606.96]EXJ85250.1 hypothetical protein A1O3_05925 [Capronia epimyces CBS 606.96]